MKIAAAYIRVSTEDQTEYSPDSQIKLIRDYAKRNGMIVPDEYIFADEGISGKTTKKRTQFNRMIGVAKRKPKPFEAILLWKYSRFARSRQDSIVYKTMLRKQLGIDVISITESLGDDKMSILIEAMIEAMDEYYSINLAEEVTRGMTEKASRGEPVSIPSFGYDIVEKQYVINAEQAPIVRMIFEDYLAGLGASQIARKINAMGILTNRGNLWANRTVDYVLNNPVYIGKIRWAPDRAERRDYYNVLSNVIDGHHEPIIDQDIWDKVQERKAKMSKTYKKYARKTPPDKGDYMLRGLIKCSSCGGSLARLNATSLQCVNYNHSQCHVSHNISIMKLNSMVLQGIHDALESGNFELLTRQPDVGTVDPRDVIDRALKRQQTMLQRVKEAYAAGVDTLNEYKANKTAIQAEIDRLKKSVPPPVDMVKIKTQFREKNLKTLESLKNISIGEDAKNELLRSFVDHIVFDRKHTRVQVFFYS